MKVIILSLCFITVVTVGCIAPMLPSPPQITTGQQEYVKPEPSRPTLQLPVYYNLSAKDSGYALRQIENAMRNLDNFKQAAGPVSPARLQRAAKRANLDGILITDCDLELLKTLIAMDRPPIVVLRNPVGGPHFWAVTGYDDNSEQFSLVNPLQNSAIRMRYDEFEEGWNAASNRRSCLIISAHAMTPQQLRINLAKYLPEEKLVDLKIRD